MKFRCLLVLAAILLGFTEAPFSAAATMTLSSPSAQPNSNVTITGSGFADGEMVTLLLDTHIAGIARADGNGSFETVIRIPLAAQPGEHGLQARGSVTDDTSLTINVGANWPMFKNQTSRLGSNPLEFIINRNNAQLAPHPTIDQ